MKFIRLKTNDPYLNLAIEEYLFKFTKDDIFMLWQNVPTVVIGKNQNAYAEVDTEYAKANGICISRRITGGGAVYHDLRNVNYTFITSDDSVNSLDYEHFTKPMIDALKALGVDCQLSGRNDIESNGRKFSGNAQHFSDGRILHHGTLLFDTDVSVMSKVLRANKEKLEYKAVKSHKSRVVNLKELIGNITIEEFIQKIEDKVVEIFNAEKIEPQIEFPEILEALFKRNASDEWIMSDKRFLTDYKVYKHKKYPFGIVNIEMKLNKNIIENILISGDFFGVKPIEELEKMLVGQKIENITSISISPYIDGMSFEEFIALIVS